MHWMRIDRYYSSDHHKDELETVGKGTYTAGRPLQPAVIFQPMMCQQCNHAPLRNGSPVLATTHGSEGLNQMTYNRCMVPATAPTTARTKCVASTGSLLPNEKFETVNGHMFTDLGRMVLNPDVTVRARCVMEKCSFCVQRIQLGKLEAKKKRRPWTVKSFRPAPSRAPGGHRIGDMRDPNSRISQLLRREDGERAFHALESIAQPNVTYLTKI
jgi:molybdopterin-containing oxidoreductase family iron-sulfur binding subunit